MKNIIITLSVVLLLGSCATTNQKHYYQKPNGEWMSKRELDRFCKQALRKAMRSVSKEDMKILMGVPITIDTNIMESSFVIDTALIDTPIIGNATDTIIHDIIWIEDTIDGIPYRYSKD